MNYDTWGNLASRHSSTGEQHYVYDAENRLIKAEGTGPEGKFAAQYHYDALGRRTRKTVTTQRGTSETRFLWQGYRLLQEQQKDRCQTYVYDPNEAYSPLARIDHLCDENNGDIFWFGTDLNGAPLDVTDEQGNICWSGQYGSFGEVRYHSDGFSRLLQTRALHHQPLRYAGQYADSETGLHYSLFRYYDPQVGRFTVQDPIGVLGGINLYQYAPNPLGWIDPWGLSFLEIIGDAADTTGKKYQGAEIYKISSKVKVDQVTFKKGDYFYLDNLHKDHYETFSSLNKSKGVFNLDGSYNEKRSIKTEKRKGPGC